MWPGLGMPELLLILLIALILFGPSRIPQLARALGEAVREFRKATSSSDKDRRKKVSDEELINVLAKKLGVSKEGKEKEEILREVLKKAKEKGLI
ncbi:MAG TPA: twin-arginine translocase TatA/TatE family subunit [Thermofilum sp.]|nr:twin-arginine translocase TatA/TatE family subunit [Thermofilum sp.]